MYVSFSMSFHRLFLLKRAWIQNSQKFPHFLPPQQRTSKDHRQCISCQIFIRYNLSLNEKLILRKKGSERENQFGKCTTEWQAEFGGGKNFFLVPAVFWLYSIFCLDVKHHRSNMVRWCGAHKFFIHWRIFLLHFSFSVKENSANTSFFSFLSFAVCRRRKL